MNILFPQVRLAALVWLLLFAHEGAAAANDVSRWDGDERSAARLIAGSRLAGATPFIRAGVEIRLKVGWHTYWRYPGDAGVPPKFDFTASQNVKEVHVLWPAPQRLPEDGGTSIGYARDLILPLHVVPQDPAKHVLLRLKLDYAVCEKLCVPAEAKAELILTNDSSAQDAALAAAEAQVPKRHALGEGKAFAIQSVRRQSGSARPRVVIDIAAPAGVPVDLFAEGPTTQWALPLPAAIDGAPEGLRRFAFDLDGAPPGASYEGVLITLTAVSGQVAIEVATRLD
jgi:DsbC/DsbD-like thiol-disulfide interchange protein